MNSRIWTRLSVGAAAMCCAALLVLALSDGPSALSQTAPAADPGVKKKADNSMCYVCHLGLKKEEITLVHLAEGYACAKCHGPSTDHMHDEMQMTPPDLKFGRREVDKMCSECHEDPHEEMKAEVKAFRKKWRGRARPNGRAVAEGSVCTDCHGTHNIDAELEAKSALQAADWAPLFNGKDLAGWRPAGNAAWTIKRGRIVGTAGAQPGGGNLWTEKLYGDYLAAVTFRADFPVHAGICLRAAEGEAGPRVEIFENKAPPAFTASVGVPGKGLALVNLRKDLFDAGGWNTISAEVRGGRVGVWLNGEEVGAACFSGPAKGRIGLYLEGGPAYTNAELAVREILVQKLPDEEAKPE